MCTLRAARTADLYVIKARSLYLLLTCSMRKKIKKTFGKVRPIYHFSPGGDVDYVQKTAQGPTVFGKYTF